MPFFGFFSVAPLMSSEKLTKPPKYRHCQGRALAVVTFDGKDFYLGGYETKESKADYHPSTHRRVVGVWRRLPTNDGLRVQRELSHPDRAKETIHNFGEEALFPRRPSAC